MQKKKRFCPFFSEPHMHEGPFSELPIRIRPPLDLDQLSGQVVKTSALESRSRGFESRPSGL